MFTVKELSSCMAAPTTLALQRLRKLIGYLKASGNMGIKLFIPEFGAGKTRQGAETFWLLETYTDADWSANKRHRRSTSCAIHMVNGNFTFGPSRTQRVVSLSSAESELHSMAQYGFRVLRCNIHQEVFRVFELQQSDPSTVD